MTTMIIKGVTCHLTDSTAEEIRRDLEAHEAEQRGWEQDMADLKAAWESGDMSYYSDVYKDIYGFRPWKLGCCPYGAAV